MKLFYGVQGTGNGHIGRSRVMAEALNSAGYDTQFLFSGRPPEKFFDMEVFGEYQVKEGLTFAIDNGKVDLVKTVLQAPLKKFKRDVAELDLSSYDAVICDYEPITAWAASRQKVFSVGIGHQYAFKYDIPKRGFNFVSSQVMKQFAPTSLGIGLHWDSFGAPILPPIIDTSLTGTLDEKTIVVYLPFENQDEVIKLLAYFTEYKFHLYSHVNVSDEMCWYKNIFLHPLSKQAFTNNLKSCGGVICNSGFELVSEALHLGKKVLVKPVKNQAEQFSNALALTQLGYGWSMDELDFGILHKWFSNARPVQVKFPDVAAALAKHLGEVESINADLVFDLWSQVEVKK